MPSHWLPTDEISYGFDNIAGVLKLSPLLTERYLNAAQKMSRLALGTPAPPNGDLYRVPDQLDQDVRLEGMPVGTRGGTRVDYLAPRDGDYDIKVRVGRGIDSDIPHFIGEQNLEISVDGERVHVFTLPATPGEDLNIERQVARAPGTGPERRPRAVDANGDPIPDEAALARRKLDDDWVIRVPIKAGLHEIRATFLMKTNAVSEGFRRPFLKPYIGRGPTDNRETREGAALREMEIMGPINPGGAETSSRAISACSSVTLRQRPAERSRRCAKTILSTLARRAYRRPVTDADLKVLLDFYNEGRATGTFEAGIELALQRILVSPSFLFRTEFDPVSSAAAAARPAIASAISSLASRLSFFLWSSIPDDELLDLADAGQAARAGRARAADAADARRSAVAGVHRQLRRPVAVAAPAEGHRSGPVPVSRLRRHAGARVSAGSRALLRQHRSRGSAADGSADGRLHVRQRAAREALRHPQREGHQLPARDAGRRQSAPRSAGQGRDPDGDRAAEPDLAGRARQVGAAERFSARRRRSRRRTCRRLQENGEKVTKVQHAARASRAAPRQRDVRVLPQADGSDRVRARELRRGRASTGLFDENFEPIDNSGVYADGTPHRWPGRTSPRAGGPLRRRSSPTSPRRCSPMRSAAASSTTTRRRSARSCATRRHRTTASRRSFSALSRALHSR